MMIELTDKEALVYKLLSQAKAWDIKSGSVELHFDSQGRPVLAETKQTHKLSTGAIKDEDLIKIVV